MTAKEAYEIALAKNNKDCEDQKIRIMNEIDTACTKGKFSVEIYESILPCNEVILQDQLGFEIKNHSNPKDGSCSIISW